MKNHVMNLIKSIVFVGVTVGVLVVLCVMFTPKTSDLEGGMTNPNARGFYGEPKNSIDILVLGDSNAYCAYSPMVIWDKYGVPSYVAAEGNQTIVGAEKLLNEVLKCQNPKLLIFDVNMLWSGNRNIQRVEDCINSMLQCDVPVVNYHDRWKNMSLKDCFKKKNYTFRSTTRGQRLSRCVKPYVGDDKMEETEDKDGIPFVTRFFFEKLLRECNDKGIEVLLIETPTATSWTYARHTAMEKYAEEKGLTFIDFNTLTGKNAIDWNADTKDGGMHMNVYGAKKVTDYLGKYISKNYSFENKKADSTYSDWNKDCSDYKKYVKKKKIYIEPDESGNGADEGDAVIEN